MVEKEKNKAADISAKEADVTEKQKAVEEARTGKKEADAEAARKQAALEQAIIETRSAKAAADSAEAFERRAKRQIAKGSLGFFERAGSEAAVGCFDTYDVPSQGTKSLCEYTVIDDEQDASSLANMKAALNRLRTYNEIRKKLGLSQLRISDELMAAAQVDANFSDQYAGYAGVFRFEEIVGWNSGSNPYLQWYYEEKGSYDRLKGNAKDAGVLLEGLEEECRNYYEEGYADTGDSIISHYEQLIKPGYVAAGAAHCTRRTMNNWCTDVQTFEYEESSNDSYGFEKYVKRFERYYNRFTEAQRNAEYAEKEYERARQKQKDAEAAKAAADTAAIHSKSALDKAESDLLSAQEQLEKSKAVEIPADGGKEDTRADHETQAAVGLRGQAIKSAEAALISADQKLTEMRAVWAAADEEVEKARVEKEAAEAASKNTAAEAAGKAGNEQWIRNAQSVLDSKKEAARIASENLAVAKENYTAIKNALTTAQIEMSLEQAEREHINDVVTKNNPPEIDLSVESELADEISREKRADKKIHLDHPQAESRGDDTDSMMNKKEESVSKDIAFDTDSEVSLTALADEHAGIFARLRAFFDRKQKSER